MAGIFDLLGSPVERQETVLRKALEARRDAWTHTDKGYLYRGGGDYLLRHGQFFSGAQLPGEYDVFMGTEGNCFENTLHACEANLTIRYFEGVYTVGAGHYTPHAWGVTPDGRLLEFTYPTDPELLATGREYRSHLPILPFEHWGYWGVEFNPIFVRSYWYTHNGVGADGQAHVGILDRPTQDTEENSVEWRDDWPIFSYPYDLRRTEP